MKKITSLIISGMLMLSMVGCGSNKENVSSVKDDYMYYTNVMYRYEEIADEYNEYAEKKDRTHSTLFNEDMNDCLEEMKVLYEEFQSYDYDETNEYSEDAYIIIEVFLGNASSSIHYKPDSSRVRYQNTHSCQENFHSSIDIDAVDDSLQNLYLNLIEE
jgi:hypothetical protein